MQFTGEQLHQIHKVILQAFPTRGRLEQFVRYKLDASLDVITIKGNLDDDVFELLKWLESKSLVVEFIIKAREFNPGSEPLRACAETFNLTVETIESKNPPAVVSTVAVAARDSQVSVEDVFDSETRHARAVIVSVIPGLPAPLQRNEIDWIEDQLKNGAAVLFTGDAGTGKSGIADKLAQSAYEAGKTAVLLDARRVAQVQSAEQLRNHFNLTTSVSEEIGAIGQKRGCRLIIEQLDNCIGYPAATVLVELALDCSKLSGVETVVVSRRRETNEMDLLRPLTRIGFQELTCHPLSFDEAAEILEQLGIAAKNDDFVNLCRNLLNLELVGRIKYEQPAFDFARVTAELELWQQYLDTVIERERIWTDPTAARRVIGEAMRLARQGLNREDRKFTLDFALSAEQSRLVSWEIIFAEDDDSRIYRFRHETLQDFLYARDAAARSLLREDVYREIHLFRADNVIAWMDKIYKQKDDEQTRERFLREFLIGVKT